MPIEVTLNDDDFYDWVPSDRRSAVSEPSQGPLTLDVVKYPSSQPKQPAQGGAEVVLNDDDYGDPKAPTKINRSVLPSTRGDVSGKYWGEVLNDLGTGFADALTFGLDKPITAAITAGLNLDKDKGLSFGQRYDKALKFMRERTKAAEERSPFAVGTGAFMAGIVPTSGAAGLTTRATTRLGKYAQNVAMGGALGAADAATRSTVRKYLANDPEAPNVLPEIATAGGLSAGVSGLVGPLGYAGSKFLTATAPVMRKIGDKLVRSDSLAARGANAVKTKLGEDRVEDAIQAWRGVGNDRLVLAPGNEFDAAAAQAARGSRDNVRKLDDVVRAEQRHNDVRMASSFNTPVLPANTPISAKADRLRTQLRDKYQYVNEKLADSTPISLNSFGGNKKAIEDHARSLAHRNPALAGEVTPDTITPIMMSQIEQDLGTGIVNAGLHPTTAAARLKQDLRDRLDKIAPGYDRMMKDYSKIYDYEAGVRAFNAGLDSKQANSLLSGMTEYERIGFVDAVLNNRAKALTKYAPVTNEALEAVGAAAAKGQYSADAAKAGFVDQIFKNIIHQDEKSIGNAVSKWLNQPKKEGIDYLRNYFQYRPSTLAVPTAVGYDWYKREKKGKK